MHPLCSWRILVNTKYNILASLGPKDVKSPGTFDNQAPETKSIITPQYAKPKIESDVTVTSPGIVQRHEQIGVLPTVKREAHYDPLTDKLEEVDVLKPEKIFAKTTNVYI